MEAILRQRRDRLFWMCLGRAEHGPPFPELVVPYQVIQGVSVGVYDSFVTKAAAVCSASRALCKRDFRTSVISGGDIIRAFPIDFFEPWIR